MINDELDPTKNPRRELDIRFSSSEQCPKCSKFALVVFEVNSNIPGDPHEGVLGKKCLWCDSRFPR